MGTLWQQRLEAAWQILVRHDRKAASGLASVLTTLVPLTEPQSGDVISATSGWAWGAIAMNLPTDASLVAETLDHEFHHLVLAAVEDLVPLVGEDDHRLYYAPWRDDPRPASALFQGIYAHLGVARFWRQQRQAEPSPNQLSELKFIRSCRAALNAGRTLDGANVLTITGRTLISGMLEQLSSWQCEPVSHAANSALAEIGLEHQLRWRITHCRPSADATDALAYAWLNNRDNKFLGPLPPSDVTPYYFRLSSDLPKFLDLRYRDPSQLAQLMKFGDSVRPSDVALLAGDYEEARNCYRQLISEKEDRIAWAGLLLARYQLAGEMEAIAQRPEIAVGVYEKVRFLTGAPPDAESLIAWLNEALIPAE
jgi:hypothetical protein